MRKILAFAWLPFLALALAAQTQPPAAGQQGNLAQIFVARPKPGSDAQYNEGRKRHMAWHRSQNDAWSVFVWEITTGDNTGAFVTGTFGHRWADYDAREKLITADEADVAKNIAPYRQSTAVSYWVFRPDISRSTDPEGSTPYVQITHFFVNPDGLPTFIDSVKKINAGIQKTNYPAAPGRWYQLVNGGQGPHFVLAVGRKNLGEMQGPEKTLDQMMAEAYGEQEGRAILDTIRKTYKSTYTELLRLRSDLSYTPGGATAK